MYSGSATRGVVAVPLRHTRHEHYTVRFTLRVWVLSIPMPKIPPILLAAIARSPTDTAEVPAELHFSIVEHLHQVNIHPVSVSADGTESERKLQRLIEARAHSILPICVANNEPSHILRLDIPSARRFAANALDSHLRFHEEPALSIYISFSENLSTCGKIERYTTLRVRAWPFELALCSWLADAPNLSLRIRDDQSALSAYMFVPDGFVVGWQNQTVNHAFRMLLMSLPGLLTSGNCERARQTPPHVVRFYRPSPPFLIVSWKPDQRGRLCIVPTVRYVPISHVAVFLDWVGTWPLNAERSGEQSEQCEPTGPGKQNKECDRRKHVSWRAARAYQVQRTETRGAADGSMPVGEQSERREHTKPGKQSEQRERTPVGEQSERREHTGFGEQNKGATDGSMPVGEQSERCEHTKPGEQSEQRERTGPGEQDKKASEASTRSRTTASTASASGEQSEQCEHMEHTNPGEQSQRTNPGQQTMGQDKAEVALRQCPQETAALARRAQGSSGTRSPRMAAKERNPKIPVPICRPMYRIDASPPPSNVPAPPPASSIPAPPTPPVSTSTMPGTRVCARAGWSSDIGSIAQFLTVSRAEPPLQPTDSLRLRPSAQVVDLPALRPSARPMRHPRPTSGRLHFGWDTLATSDRPHTDGTSLATRVPLTPVHPSAPGSDVAAD
ncbi:hypothetical protein K488DRAFT_75014 [Vararia minispora EC-137]|uniref:Uncharacterized protein n=1 Tax=Vararia minispora EC-137 TaxID=1314806 RepID=A0ACB8Q5L1_9AGAM|nr:hypothetical protein K488DRAFT_75014 [Vararia minispora EC-137]